MKQASQHRSMLRIAQTAIASAAFALLAACGGGGGGNSSSNAPASGVNLQVVSFGTSLSDAGTYSPVILPSFGGGRFTTNPGEVWAQKVSEYFGNSLTPAYEGGFGQPLQATGGLDYAQGGSLVSLGGTLNSPAATEMPITWQIQQYLSQHGSFNANQLVLVDGGANEILNFVRDPTFAAFGAAIAGNQATFAGQVAALAPTLIASGAASTPAQAQAIASAIVLAQFMASSASTFPLAAQIIAAAQTLAQQVTTQIVAKGATKVAVANVPDIGQTPAAQAANQTNPAAGTLLTAVTAAFNVTLAQGLQAAIVAKQVVPIDTFSFIDNEVAKFQSLGFTVSNTATACNLTLMQNNATAYANANPAVLTGTGLTAPEYGQQFGSSLFCSPQTLVSANAPTTYMFADSVHPTTALHAQFAQQAETTLAAAGIGKAP